MSAVDADLDGWLPASHAVFNGRAPADVSLGYNPKFLCECGWPLPFIDKASLSWQRYVSTSDDPLRSMVPSEFYQFDDTTIWWLTNESRYLPWDYLDTYEHGGKTGGEPQAYRQRLWLDVLDTAHGRQDRMVSSLRAKDGSGLEISQWPVGGPATTGDLLIDLILKFNMKDDKDASATAIKAVLPRPLVFAQNSLTTLFLPLS